MDLRGRLVVGNVVSARPAIVTSDRRLYGVVQGAERLSQTGVGGWWHHCTLMVEARDAHANDGGERVSALTHGVHCGMGSSMFC